MIVLKAYYCLCYLAEYYLIDMERAVPLAMKIRLINFTSFIPEYYLHMISQDSLRAAWNPKLSMKIDQIYLLTESR